MKDIYFGEWKSGRLKGLPYLGYYLLLMFLFVLIIIGGSFLLGGLGSMMSGDMSSMSEALGDGGGIVVGLLFVVIFIAFFVAQFNIFAKRIRDMGLSVLWTIVGIFILSIAINIIFPPHNVAIQSTTIETANSMMQSSSTTVSASMPANILNLFIFLALIFVPSDTFKKRSE